MKNEKKAFTTASTRAGKILPKKKQRIYSQKYGAKYARKWRRDNPDACSWVCCRRPRLLNRSLCSYHTKANYEVNRKSKDKRKIEVLSHYSTNGKLRCSWRGCDVSDIDMLSLDHKNNDGAKERRSGYDGCGDGLYRKVKREGYPNGFQTLCHNHQWKKEIRRRFKLRK